MRGREEEKARWRGQEEDEQRQKVTGWADDAWFMARCGLGNAAIPAGASSRSLHRGTLKRWPTMRNHGGWSAPWPTAASAGVQLSWMWPFHSCALAVLWSPLSQFHVLRLSKVVSRLPHSARSASARGRSCPVASRSRKGHWQWLQTRSSKQSILIARLPCGAHTARRTPPDR